MKRHFIRFMAETKGDSKVRGLTRLVHKTSSFLRSPTLFFLLGGPRGIQWVFGLIGQGRSLCQRCLYFECFLQLFSVLLVFK